MITETFYDRTFINSFHERLESIQYNAALAITGAIRGSSREKRYQELGFESLQQRRWYRKPCLFYKIINSFHERLESIQYNAALAITGAIRGSSREKRYQELGFESLQQRRWYRKPCLFYKIIKKPISQVPV